MLLEVLKVKLYSGVLVLECCNDREAGSKELDKITSSKVKRIIPRFISIEKAITIALVLSGTKEQDC